MLGGERGRERNGFVRWRTFRKASGEEGWVGTPTGLMTGATFDLGNLVLPCILISRLDG